MLITVYADRRLHEVTDVAMRLAGALATGATPADPRPVLLLAEGANAPPEAGVVQRAVSDVVSPEELGVLLDDEEPGHRAIVVALSGVVDERALLLFDASDRVLLLSAPSVASIRGVQRTLRLCQSLGYGLDKTAIVLHDFGEDSGLDPVDAAHALKREIFWTLPAREPDSPEGGRQAYARLAERLTTAG